jgi:secondary thiamine-phosphate synthase enzyme|tara:strand:+ start:16 stop:435 length:420 start_codon:yes stop_codon:yes gene_type:complete
MWYQKEITIKNKNRGFHLITNEIIQNFKELPKVSTGILHLFIKHTSASLTINENYSQQVRNDFETHFNKMVPEGAQHYTHLEEGPDDMPAHIKSSILGNTLTIPISNGNLNLGTWQGIYLCEHRNNCDTRKIVLTLQGK